MKSRSKKDKTTLAVIGTSLKLLGQSILYLVDFTDTLRYMMAAPIPKIYSSTCACVPLVLDHVELPYVPVLAVHLVIFWLDGLMQEHYSHVIIVAVPYQKIEFLGFSYFQDFGVKTCRQKYKKIMTRFYYSYFPFSSSINKENGKSQQCLSSSSQGPIPGWSILGSF